MGFFKKERKGGKCGHGATGGGIKGMYQQLVNVAYMIPGAGPNKGYEQNVIKRSGANKK